MTLKSGMGCREVGAMPGGRGETGRVWRRGSQGRGLRTEGRGNTAECELRLNEVWWTEKGEKPPYLLLI